MILNLEAYPHIKAIHIWQEDELIFNDLKTYKENDLFPVGCIFKSFVSGLVGMAIHERKIGSITDKITDYYQEYKLREGWNHCTISNALSKTTGLLWPGPNETLPKNMSEVFQLPFVNAPGTTFRYQPDPQIMVYLLEDIYGKSITELLKEKLFSYNQGYEWKWSKENIEGMQVSIRLLDEFGKLYLNKGTIGSNIIFDEEFYQLSIKKYSVGGFPEGLPYGLGWWIGSHKEVPYFFAAGFGGQVLGIVPEKNMVISILSEMNRPHPENRWLIHQVIEQ